MKRSGQASIWVFVLIAVFVAFRLFSHYRQDKPVIVNYQRNVTLNRDAKIILTKHARCRMDCRQITFDEIEEIVKDGEVNERKSELDTDKPKYAMEGYSHEKQHIRVILAPEGNGLVVVSCIDLDKEWSCSCD